MFAFIGQTNPIDYASISRHKCHVSKYWQNSLYLLLCLFMSLCDICKNYANCLIRHLNVQWALISPVCLPIMHSTGLRLGGSWECALNKHNALYMQICLTHTNSVSFFSQTVKCHLFFGVCLLGVKHKPQKSRMSYGLSGCNKGISKTLQRCHFSAHP